LNVVKLVNFLKNGNLVTFRIFHSAKPKLMLDFVI